MVSLFLIAALGSVSAQCLPGLPKEAKCFCENGAAATGLDCQRSGIKCGSCDDGLVLNPDTWRCGTKKCVCTNGTPVSGDDCDADGMEICAACDDGYKMDWGGDAPTCKPVPLPVCPCFQGVGNPQGVVYKADDVVVSYVDGKRKETNHCTEEKRNACIACPQPGWVLDASINTCRPEGDNCTISFYQGCNYTGKVCHMSWLSNAWYPGQPGSGTSAEWDARDNFKNFASYDAKQCDWMSSGVGSIKRPTKNQVPTFKCMLRLRTVDDYPTAQNSRKFRVLMHDQEVQCFEKSEHNMNGGPEDVDKEIAVNVAAVTREWDNPPPAPPARRQPH